MPVADLPYRYPLVWSDQFKQLEKQEIDALIASIFASLDQPAQAKCARRTASPQTSVRARDNLVVQP
jgi:hypothetical protein